MDFVNRLFGVPAKAPLEVDDILSSFAAQVDELKAVARRHAGFAEYQESQMVEAAERVRFHDEQTKRAVKAANKIELFLA